MVKRSAEDKPMARNVHRDDVLSARVYMNLVVELQTASHTYYVACATGRDQANTTNRAAAAARAMDAAWTLCEHHNGVIYPDCSAQMAWATIAKRWTTTVEGLIPQLSLPIAMEYRQRTANWRLLVNLPVVPDPQYTQYPASVERDLRS